MKNSLYVLAHSLLALVASGQNFTNPVLWEDLADLDIFRVDDTFYYSASNMHYSPGAPILQSYDLVNWEYIGHSVPILDFGSQYNLEDGQNAYVKGIWASTMRYRASNNLFYWIGCVDFNTTYVYTSSSVSSQWRKSSKTATCYYDAGMLIDDDDTLYVAYGNTQLSVAQLSPDGLSQVSTQVVFNTPSDVGDLEEAGCIKSMEPTTSSSQSLQKLLLDLGTPILGGGTPHQGGLVETQSGDWYYMAFVDSYPGGHIPVLAPITWGSDGFPSIRTVDGIWGSSYPYPLPAQPVSAHTGTDSFSGRALGPEWEWNHNPDTSRYSVNNGLSLSTATITSNLYAARNTLTHRILGPTSSGTIVLKYENMVDGDRTGFALLRDTSAWIGVQRNGDTFQISMWSGLTMTSTWTTASTGAEVAGVDISGGEVWLRIYADITVGSDKQGTFSYSMDGVTFTQLGSLTLNNAWPFFMGYRYAIFNYATISLGGSVEVSSFTVDSPGVTVSS